MPKPNILGPRGSPSKLPNALTADYGDVLLKTTDLIRTSSKRPYFDISMKKATDTNKTYSWTIPARLGAGIVQQPEPQQVMQHPPAKRLMTPRDKRGAPVTIVR